MKKSLVILLLSLLLLNTSWYYADYFFDREMVREEAATEIRSGGLDTEHSVVLQFPIRNGEIKAAGLSFTDDEDELSYNGQMYDVITTTRSRDSVTFVCYSDTKETALNENLSRQVEADRDITPAQQKNKTASRQLIREYTYDTYCVLFDQAINAFSCLPADISVQAQIVYSTVISPPPEA